MSIKDIANELSRLNMSVYSPFDYILDTKISIYEAIYDMDVNEGRSRLRQKDREKSLKVLMRINLLKRLESSVHAFKLTIERMINNINDRIDAIDRFEKYGTSKSYADANISDYSSDDDIDEELFNEDFSIGDKIKVNLEDMNTIGWKQDLSFDYNILNNLLEKIKQVTPDRDLKLQELKNMIKDKVNNSINLNNKKILIFSAFADTTSYLYNNLANNLKDELNLNTALVEGGGQNKCTLDIDKDFNNLLINFSPISKNRDLLQGEKLYEIDILIATDCISEGQNLQDCDYLINYDIHWNPVRIIQRFR